MRSSGPQGGAAVLMLAAAAILASCGRQESHSGTVEELVSLHLREGPPTSVLFVLIDTLRADRLSGHGYARPTSPFLDALARSGVSFRRVLSPSSWTKPAVASIFTASYPATHGVLRADDALPQAARLPAEVFHDAGYRTGAIGGNHWLAKRFGLDQGFDTHLRFTRDFVRGQRKTDAASGAEGLWGDRHITESALEFLRAHGREPFFLYLHYMGVHNHESDPAPPHFGEDPALLYDNAVAEVDRQVARVVGALDELGLRSHTLVLVTSDHGESLSERGFDGHGYSLYAEEVNVPLLLAPPFRLDPPLVVNTPVSSVDIFPTLYAMLGLPQPPHADGRSLLGILSAGPGAPVDAVPVFSHLDRRWSELGRSPQPLAAVLVRRLYLVQDLEDPTRAELFDVLADPSQRQNLARGGPPGQLDPLRSQLRAYAEREPAWGAAQSVELGPEILGELEQLGYVIQPEAEERSSSDPDRR